MSDSGGVWGGGTVWGTHTHTGTFVIPPQHASPHTIAGIVRDLRTSLSLISDICIVDNAQGYDVGLTEGFNDVDMQPGEIPLLEI